MESEAQAAAHANVAHTQAQLQYVSPQADTSDLQAAIYRSSYYYKCVQGEPRLVFLALDSKEANKQSLKKDAAKKTDSRFEAKAFKAKVHSHVSPYPHSLRSPRSLLTVSPYADSLDSPQSLLTPIVFSLYFPPVSLRSACTRI